MRNSDEGKMKHHVFICYPVQNQDLVENFAGRLREVGVEAWMYSLNRTLAEEVWCEIEEKIQCCELFIFIASSHSQNANGQHREVQLAVNQVKETNAKLRMIPVLIGPMKFENLPDELSHVNGVRLDAYSVQTTALEIAKTIFPDLLDTEKRQDWKYPKPGQWLEVCLIDQCIEEYFDLGDSIYFRRISPLGLFECYAPKLKGLFWFAPHNLCATDTVDEGGEIEREQVPKIYRYGTSYECERIGLEEMKKTGDFLNRFEK